jgi:hypothetical protein
LAFNSGLLLGPYSKTKTDSAILVRPYSSGGRPAVNYKVVHSGATQTLLYGVSRGLHFRINRQTLLDSIAARLGSGSGATGSFDTRFFVPYAEIKLPLADSLAQVDGPFALDMQLISDVDSVAPQSALESIPVSIGDSIRLYPVRNGGEGYSGPDDTLICGYRRHPVDTGMRQVILRWSRASAITDTILVQPDGKWREFGLKRYSGLYRQASIKLAPGSETVSVEVFFSTSGIIEPRHFLDSAGKPVSANADSKRRFWNPGAKELAVRSTYGMRNLLNRVALPGITPDLFLRPADRNAFDTTGAGGGAGYLRVYYPVLGEIDFPRDNGLLQVTLDIYLYPLAAP